MLFVNLVYLVANFVTFLLRFVIFHYVLFAEPTTAARAAATGPDAMPPGTRKAPRPAEAPHTAAPAATAEATAGGGGSESAQSGESGGAQPAATAKPAASPPLPPPPRPPRSKAPSQRGHLPPHRPLPLTSRTGAGAARDIVYPICLN